MLKISRIDNAKQRRLILEGKLVGPWAAELKRACEEATANLRGRELVVEMKHVTAISQNGENVILDLLNRGIKFRSNELFTKHVLKELTRQTNGRGQQKFSNSIEGEKHDQANFYRPS